jgi:hypothetical protein
MKISKKQRMNHPLRLKVISSLLCLYLRDFIDEFGEKDDVEFNSDELVDSAQVCDKVGDVTDCYHGSGKVTKEIL